MLPRAAEEVACDFVSDRRLVLDASNNLYYTTHTQFLANLSTAWGFSYGDFSIRDKIITHANTY